jgi:hypothetical protein
MTLIASLPGKAKAAMGNLGSALFSAGADLVRGFINGIQSACRRASLTAAKHGEVGPQRSQERSRDQLAVPVFRDEVGAQIGAGLVEGINGVERRCQRGRVRSLVAVPSVSARAVPCGLLLRPTRAAVASEAVA